MYQGGQLAGTVGQAQPYWKWQRSMGVDTCFDKAGEQQGLRVWRVEKMKLVPVPKSNFGTFFTGDAYLVLHRDEERAHLHIWHGEKASSDEKGASALFATQLDDSLQGRPVQHREVQGNESDLFMTYFPSGIKYQVQRNWLSLMGRRANSEEKQAALKVAEDVISQRNYPSNTQVEIIPEGLETAFFKQFFKDWN
ncbi:macrophage-capping protein-like [Scyliorhinus canicula]|uniref:macrophage-capping protein-like n=1 Tax=Scyliorhinus canicula TaxID=7830 RepID=UPI0018F56419|nr:macrophage-capping protein-like [Scyliorhinus canicula]